MAPKLLPEVILQMQLLRKQLRTLREKKKRHDATKAWQPTPGIRRAAVLILRLIDEPKWCMIYVRSWQASNFARSAALPSAVTEATIRAWNFELQGDAALEIMLTDLAHPTRVRVDCFLMESIVFEDIESQSKKDIPIPSSMVVDKYLRAWDLRPRCAQVDAHIDRLRNSRRARRVWGRSFRRRWGLSWGARASSHDITEEELKNKAGEKNWHARPPA